MISRKVFVSDGRGKNCVIPVKDFMLNKRI